MRSPPGRARFPLSDWIDERAALPHQLSSSGMGRQLRSADAAFRARRPVSEEELTDLFAGVVGVASERLFLAHGATEANALVLLHLARQLRKDHGRTPRVRIDLPEYPPLRDAAAFAGFAPTRTRARADLVVRSDPNNPTGLRSPAGSLAGGASELIDETFREFRPARSNACAGRPRTWVTGTLTKVYGADEVRVGFVVAPPEAVDPFAGTLGLLMDRIPAASRAQAAALLNVRERVLREVRAIFERNLAVLRRNVAGTPRLHAPVWFDRPGAGLSGTALANTCARRGVLVAPGRYFGDDSGVRVCLTRRSFPADLAAYLRVRKDLAPAD